MKGSDTKADALPWKLPSPGPEGFVPAKMEPEINKIKIKWSQYGPLCGLNGGRNGPRKEGDEGEQG